jgi:hypothetical protein
MMHDGYGMDGSATMVFLMLISVAVVIGVGIMLGHALSQGAWVDRDSNAPERAADQCSPQSRP